ncbi:spermidine synthase isoform X3 [Rhincodon typus]|uniref:spermidine synthase isoform X3 n=1 Tax=Rhincodon typus TaxID=259920 RepID=UPI00202F3EE3|nr:spermidine synthase isoform X3 [Rhincodon typus]
MDTIKNGWFTETSSLWPGQAMSLEVDKVLYNQKSPFQDVVVFKSKTYGNVLVLDGVIQCTERDEFAYQEMIANLALCSHPNPKKTAVKALALATSLGMKCPGAELWRGKIHTAVETTAGQEYNLHDSTPSMVLIIGGGDGGVLREVVKHAAVESVAQCEIDEDVIKVSKQYLPGMAVGFSSPKLKLHVGDGFEFMKENQDAFDVIITDSSDPVGPAESLFQESYYRLMKNALHEDGILGAQGH